MDVEDRHAHPRPERLVARTATGPAGDTPRLARILNWGESNLVRACRRFAEGEAAWALVPQQIWLVCGIASVESVLHTTEAFMRLLLGASRRPLVIREAGAETLSADEIALVALVAAAQRGHGAHVEAISRWLVIVSAQASLAKRAEALARALSASGLHLRRCQPPEPPVLAFEESA